MSTFKIANKEFSPRSPVFCIAEIGVNHNQDLVLAKEMIDAAAWAGADAVKFQTFQAEDVTISKTPMAGYQKENTGFEGNQQDLLKKYELSIDQHEELAAFAKEKNILFLSTSHSGMKGTQLLIQLGVMAFKVGSGDLTNIPYLKELSTLSQPVILSTGMSDLSEVDRAISAFSDSKTSLMLLHCTSEYPCPPENVNLRAMQTLFEKFKFPVGYSDHTLGKEAGLLATELGAVCLEKHFTLDKTLPGPDHKASAEPKELKDYISSVQALRSQGSSTSALSSKQRDLLLGSSEKKPTEQERETRKLVRKSLIAAQDLNVGHILSEKDIAIKRPGTGIPPYDLMSLCGKKLLIDKLRDEPFAWSDFS